MMESERLILRTLQVEDAAAMYALAKEQEVGYACGWKPHADVAETKMLLEKFLVNPRTFAIVDKKDNTFYGVISLEEDRKRKGEVFAELGYWIGKPYWGQGIVVEAANLLLRYGFEQLHLSLISVCHFTFNQQSKRVIEKLGFVYEGVIRESYQHYALGWIDCVSYSLKYSEFCACNE